MKELKFMAVAEAMMNMSKDPSTKTASVALDDDLNVLATGYNGFPRGVKDTPERWNNRELKYPRVIHGEANMVAAAARTGRSLKGSTVVVTTLFPCSGCAGLMAQAGVRRVITTKPNIERWSESNALAQEIFDESGVEVVIVEKDAEGKWGVVSQTPYLLADLMAEHVAHHPV
jgi:dCMP deaminase